MSTSTPTARASDSVEELLARARPDRPRGLGGRELQVELALAMLVVAGAMACAVGLPSERSVDLAGLAAGVLAFAVSTRVRLYVGGGSALATQLVFVPLLFLLPLNLVPLVVVAGLVLGTLPGVLGRRREPRVRALTAIGDAGYVFAPVAVLSAAGETVADFGQWRVLAVAFGAQFVLDCALSVAREWLGRGIRPSLQLRVMATVYAVDALLVPVGLLTAEATAGQPLGVLATLPLALLLAALARDRTVRVNAALDRLAELELERERVRVAIHRTARSLGYSLDRGAMLEVALGTAVDAVAAVAGRARLAGATGSLVFEALPQRPGDGEADALLAVERAALAGDATAANEHGRWAIGCPLLATREPAILGALAVCRDAGPFSREQSELFAYLAAQTAASIEAIDLHERLRNPDLQDELTGLANHRRFRELLHADVERSRHGGRPLSVLLVDLDELRRINAERGFTAGDEALCTAAGIVREQAGGDAARVGAGTLAVALAGSGLDAAVEIGGDIHAALARCGLSASIGIAELSSRVATPDALIAGAEAACREAKRAGKGRLAGFRGPYGRPSVRSR